MATRRHTASAKPFSIVRMSARAPSLAGRGFVAMAVIAAAAAAFGG